MARGRGKLTPHEIEAMKVVSDNLQRILFDRNLKQSQVADALNIPRSTFNDYIKGNTLPIPGNIQKIADYFGLLKSDIDPRFASPTYSASPPISDTAKAISETVEKLEEPRRVIVLDTAKTQLREQEIASSEVHEPIRLYNYDYYDQPASAGTGQYLNDVKVEQVQLPIDVKADFVIPIYGDSMEPEYHSGDYVFIRLSVDLSDGDIGVFEYYGDAYIKQLIINENGAFLHSFNSDYDDIPIDADSDFRIIGEVVESFSQI